MLIRLLPLIFRFLSLVWCCCFQCVPLYPNSPCGVLGASIYPWHWPTPSSFEGKNGEIISLAEFYWHSTTLVVMGVSMSRKRLTTTPVGVSYRWLGRSLRVLQWHFHSSLYLIIPSRWVPSFRWTTSPKMLIILVLDLAMLSAVKFLSTDAWWVVE